MALANDFVARLSGASLAQLRSEPNRLQEVTAIFNKFDKCDKIDHASGPLLTKILRNGCLRLDQLARETVEETLPPLPSLPSSPSSLLSLPRLTSLHAACLKVAANCRCFLLVKQITDTEYDGPDDRLVTKHDITSFHYYRAVILIQNRQFKRAYESLNICMSIPHQSSNLLIRCLKVYALTSILVDPRFQVPLGERKEAVERACSLYLQFAESSSLGDMISLLQDHKQVFEEDGLYEVAYMCVEEKLLRIIQSLSGVYVSIRLEDINNLAELKGLQPQKEGNDREKERDDSVVADELESADKLEPEEPQTSKSVGTELSRHPHRHHRRHHTDPALLFGDLTQEIQRFLFTGRLLGTLKHSTDSSSDVLIFKQDRKSVATYVNRLESLLAQTAAVTQKLSSAGTDIVYMPEFARKIKSLNKRGLEDSKVTIRDDKLYISPSQRRKLSKQDSESSDDERMLTD